MKQLEGNGIEVRHNSNEPGAETVIINTCGFIRYAKHESIEVILYYVREKELGKIGKVYVIGCLTERYKDELSIEIQGVDQFFGVKNLKEILKTLGAVYKKELIGKRILSTPHHYAYMKISEGCDRTCSFCAIPLIKGPHHSRPVKEIMKEAENLASQGVKELILIAQDLTYYGVDTYKKANLAYLLEQLSAIREFEWIRLHYVYPANFPTGIIPLIKERKNICRYIDIPFQHISDHILKIMRRGIEKEEILGLIRYFRKEIPEMAIRTTLLVGHPGESKRNFEELKQFVKEVEFDRLGIFTYSHEENTHSYSRYKDDIPEKIKQERADEIMHIQEQVSNRMNKNKVGKVFKVIIDREEHKFMVGRTEYDSPEIDNEVLVRKDQKTTRPGEFYNVKITNSESFDLFGKIV